MASANFVDLSTVLKTFCGKQQYTAQEVMQGQWASSLCSFKPYSLKGTAGASVLSSTSYSALQQGQEELQEQILTANYTFYP